MKSEHSWRPFATTLLLIVLFLLVVARLGGRFTDGEQALSSAIWLLAATLLSIATADYLAKADDQRRRVIAAGAWLLLLLAVFLGDAPGLSDRVSEKIEDYPLATGALTSILVLGVGLLAVDAERARQRALRAKSTGELVFFSIHLHFKPLVYAYFALLQQKHKTHTGAIAKFAEMYGHLDALVRETEVWLPTLASMDDDSLRLASGNLVELRYQAQRLMTEVAPLANTGPLVSPDAEGVHYMQIPDDGSFTYGAYHFSSPPEVNTVLSAEQAAMLVARDPFLLPRSELRSISQIIDQLGIRYEQLRYTLDVTNGLAALLARLWLRTPQESWEHLDAAGMRERSVSLVATFGTMHEGAAYCWPHHEFNRHGFAAPTESLPAFVGERVELLEARRLFAERHKDLIRSWSYEVESAIDFHGQPCRQVVIDQSVEIADWLSLREEDAERRTVAADALWRGPGSEKLHTPGRED